ncbi:cytochrome b [Vreelandella neptunia]|uniref:Cytochrome b n=1 Tax=Vreelandella neptunia TaxID=115551 RepID=A0ABS9SBG5_9GAMM|nr:cytochrome b [Halomonas neptunia]MCH4813458.1 cytochrome b [Halomonas neptunia]
MSILVMDTKVRYGAVSRFFHWGMALLFAWQFTSATAHWLFPDTPFEEFFWGTHYTVGVSLLSLVVLRALWALANASRRPPSVSVMAKLGHIALYGLMIAVPTIALIRQFGSGRSLEVFGITLMAGFEGEEITWMTDLGGLLHGELGWTLLALVVGHIVMAFLHRKLTHHNVLTRMR